MNLAKFTENKGLLAAVAAVVALTLFFGLDSLVRRKRFDPPNQIEDYVEGRVTFDRIARAWGKKDSPAPVNYFERVPAVPPPPRPDFGGLEITKEETNFLIHIKDYLPNYKTLELDQLTFSSPGFEHREVFVNTIMDLCGHRVTSVELIRSAPSPVDMPVDKDGNKVQYVGKLIVNFDRDDLPEFRMDAVTLYPKSWENPIGRTSDGTVYLIPVEEIILKT